MMCCVLNITATWILTEGLSRGVAREVGKAFRYQENREETAGLKGVSLLGFCHWGMVEDNEMLQRYVRRALEDILAKICISI